MTNITKELRYAELVIKPCSLDYGVAPCTAEVGTTGSYKCYNSPRTCQDAANFDEGGEQVLRWVVPTEDLPLEIDAQPCITSINRRPLLIDPGEGLGVRESVTVTMHDFLHNDDGFDKYPDSRTSNPYNKGTYWGKFTARWGSLEGYEFRTVDGYQGQSLSEMTRRYYTVNGTAGPDSNGNFSFTVKDAMKFIDGDKGQWPRPSSGTLLAAITDTGTAITLDPAGAGAGYPASGTASINDEAVTYTRVGDVVTLTGRGLFGSPQEAHEAGETFQSAAVYDAIDPPDIIYDLLSNGTSMPAEYLDLAGWKAETNAFLGRLYSGKVMQPTPVRDLIQEIIQDAGLTFFVDLVAKKITLRVLRQEVPIASIDDDFVIAGTLKSKKLYSKRISESWIYYGKKNPLEKQSEKKNYKAVYAAITQDPVIALENNPPAIRDTASRWMTVFNLPAVKDVTERLLARYETAPNEVGFKIMNTFPLALGDFINFSSRIFLDSQGDIAPPVNLQVMQIDDSKGVLSVIAEEVNFSKIDPGTDRNIFINADTYNINLREVHDSIYTDVSSGDVVVLNIVSGITIGSLNSYYALDIGDWPAGVTIKIAGDGRIQGRGGNGSQQAAQDGGPAMLTAVAVDVSGDIEIWGGGGAGATWVTGGAGGSGPAAGFGGAGNVPGQPGGTTEAGGTGNGPNGGDPGQSGVDFGGGIGGAAGYAINGVSFVTISGTADIRGPQIN